MAQSRAFVLAAGVALLVAIAPSTLWSQKIGGIVLTLSKRFEP